jgi:hypothetical protein
LHISEKTVLTYIFTNTSFKFKRVSFTTSDTHILYRYEPKCYTTHWDQHFHFHCYLLLVYDLETKLATKFVKTNELHHIAVSFHHTNLHTSAYKCVSARNQYIVRVGAKHSSNITLLFILCILPFVYRFPTSRTINLVVLNLKLSSFKP